MRKLRTVALLLSGVLMLGACSSTKLDDNAKIEDRNAKPVTTTPADARTVAPITTGSGAEDSGPTTGILAKRSVYFDFDSYIVKDEFKPLVEAHAHYLGSHKVGKIVIQGNTDEPVS